MRRLVILELVAASGCVPTGTFEVPMDPEVQAIVSLLVPNCLGENGQVTDPSAMRDEGGCVASAVNSWVFARGIDEELKLNVGTTDRVFVAQYRHGKEELGLPADVELTNSSACPLRPFPEALSVERHDALTDDAALDAVPIDRFLPKFPAQACLQDGNCLALGPDNVPICSQECAPKEIEPPAELQLALPSVQCDVPVKNSCLEWFNFELEACDVEPRRNPDCAPYTPSCDGAGWPQVSATDPRYLDPGAAPGGTGSIGSPYATLAEARADTPSVLFLRGRVHDFDVPIDWDVELVGCRPTAINATEIRSGLPNIQIAADVSLSDVTVYAELFVATGSLELANVTMEGPPLVLSRGTRGELTRVVMRPTSTTAIRAEAATLIGRDLYLSGGAFRVGGDGLECNGGTLDLMNFFIASIPGSAVVARRCDLKLNQGSIDDVGLHGVLVEAATATIADVWIARYGRTPQLVSDGVRIRDGAVKAQRLSVGPGAMRVPGKRPPAAIALDRIPNRVGPAPSLSLELEGASLFGVPIGLHANGGTVLLRNADINARGTGLELLPGTIATLDQVSIMGVAGIVLDSAALTADVVQIAAATALDFSGTTYCGVPCLPRVVLRDVKIESDEEALVLDTTPDASPIRLERIAIQSAQDGVRMMGGTLELRNVRFEAIGSMQFAFLIDPLETVRLKVEQSIIVGGTALSIVGDDAALEDVRVEKFEARLFEMERVLSTEVCTAVPHRFLAGAVVEGEVPAPAINYPGAEQ